MIGLLIVIAAFLLYISAGVTCMTLMMAAIVSKTEKPEAKNYEEAQADLFKAWGDTICNKN